MRPACVLVLGLLAAGCRSGLLDELPPASDAGTHASDLGHALEPPPDLAQQGCGGLAQAPCPKGMYCEIPEGSFCGGNDTGGVCTAKPDGCTKELDPVCGCDRQTYSNDCERRRAGVSRDHAGACDVSPFACGAETCGAGEYCFKGCSGISNNQPPPVCKPVPQSCTTMPSCSCVGIALGGLGPTLSCTTDPGGGVTLTQMLCP